MKESSTIKWLKKIFSVSTLSVIIALTSLIIAYFTYLNSTSGNLKLTVNNKETPILFEEGVSMQSLHISSDSIAYPNKQLLHMENTSSRSIKNFHYEVLFIPHGKCYVDLNEDFERIKSNIYRYKYDNLPPHGWLNSPFNSITFYDQQLYTEVIYNITYEGIDKAIIFPCNILFFNNLGKELNEQNYMQLRNSFIKAYIHDNLDKEEAKKTVLSIEDTTIVGIFNYDACNTDNYSLNSLSSLNEKPSKTTKVNWLNLIFFLITPIFLMIIYISDVGIKRILNFESMYSFVAEKNKNKQWKNISLGDKIWIIICASFYLIYSPLAILFSIYSIIFNPSFFIE